MANFEIKQKIKEMGLFQWQVAENMELAKVNFADYYEVNFRKPIKRKSKGLSKFFIKRNRRK